MPQAWWERLSEVSSCISETFPYCVLGSYVSGLCVQPDDEFMSEGYAYLHFGFALQLKS